LEFFLKNETISNQLLGRMTTAWIMYSFPVLFYLENTVTSVFTIVVISLLLSNDFIAAASISCFFLLALNVANI